MQDMEREAGFHEGVRFACEVIERALIKNSDMPLLAFKIARDAMLENRRPAVSGKGNKMESELDMVIGLNNVEAQNAKIKCQCGFNGRAKDLVAPDDDNESIPCPRCGQATWEFV